jgi:hypothetical protein
MSRPHELPLRAYSRIVRETWVNLAGAVAVAVVLAGLLWLVMHLGFGW